MIRRLGATGSTRRPDLTAAVTAGAGGVLVRPADGGIHRHPPADQPPASAKTISLAQISRRSEWGGAAAPQPSGGVAAAVGRRRGSLLCYSACGCATAADGERPMTTAPTISPMTARAAAIRNGSPACRAGANPSPT